MSLDDLVDRLIAEKTQPLASGADMPAGMPPATGSEIGQSLSHLLNKVSADHGENDGSGAVLDDQTRAKLAAFDQLQMQAAALQQRTKQLESDCNVKDEEYKRLAEQHNTLKEKTKQLVTEYQRLRDGGAPNPNVQTEAMTGTPAATADSGNQAAANFPWRKHLTVVQDNINRKEIAAGEAILKVLIDASEAMSAETATRLRLMTQMGTIKMDNGHVGDAEQLLNQAAALMDKTGARKSVAGAYCLDGLAQCAQLQEDFENAEKLRREAVVIADDVLGAEHPEAAFFRERLEGLRQERQMFQMGGDEGSKTVLDKLTDEYNAAVAAGQTPEKPQLKPTEALAGLMFEKYTANAKSALAQKNMRDSESFLRSAMDKAEGISNDDIRKYEAIRLLAATLELQNKDAEAKQLYEQGLTLAFKYLGWNDPQVAHSLAALAELHSRINDFGLCKNYYKQAIAAYSVVLGNDDPKVLELKNKYEEFILRVKEERKWKGWSQ
jgi:hypothetical protein